MKTEEIEKAARLCAMGYTHYEGKTIREIDLEQSDFSNIFKAGVEFSNKHWQEKTRWIPAEERLPVFGGKVRTILVKTSDNLYSFLWVMQEISLLDFKLQSYTHWKEIEL